MKFFDKQMHEIIEESFYMKLLEKLVRGKSSSTPTEATLHFADTFKKKIQQAGCLDEDGNIIRDKL